MGGALCIHANKRAGLGGGNEASRLAAWAAPDAAPKVGTGMWHKAVSIASAKFCQKRATGSVNLGLCAASANNCARQSGLEGVSASAQSKVECFVRITEGGGDRGADSTAKNPY